MKSLIAIIHQLLVFITKACLKMDRSSACQMVSYCSISLSSFKKVFNDLHMLHVLYPNFIAEISFILQLDISLLLKFVINDYLFIAIIKIIVQSNNSKLFQLNLQYYTGT